MTSQLTVYGVSDIKPALDTIGATTRQLSYLVTKGYIEPSVKLVGRLGYTRDDLARIFLMLGPLRTLEPSVRRKVAVTLAERGLGGVGTKDEFLEVDLEDSKQDRCPAVVLRVDRQELVADFAMFMGAVHGVTDAFREAVRSS